ncbi:MAG: precorrin-3B C(17)-methyltransferase, partial [Lachnospiraceae bacterium]|nr:precorrin-3B C(17)-methyltransferase [Lachnospiraceae bacterium]
IEKRLAAAAAGDFAIALYNPASHKRKDHLRKACDILLQYMEEERPCGYVENIGREGTKAVTCTLRDLRERQLNMFTTVFIGNSGSEIINGKLVTKRGYICGRK